MKIYIAGPVTGIPGHNRPAFESEAARIRAAGHEPVNPLDVCPFDPARPWADYMKADLPAMLDCDAVHVLPGWIESRGASLEVAIARELEIPLVFV